jgi:drug/metabolite transporter (DMT)-like permease
VDKIVSSILLTNAYPAFQPAPMYRGIALKIISTLAFTFMASAVKLIGVQHPGDPLYYPVGQTVFCRSLFALIPVFIWLGWRNELVSAFKGSSIRRHARRGFFGSVGMFSGFTGLILLPLADATAISYAAPLFTVVLAAIILKEKVRLYRWSAVGIGFLGVLVMLVPYFDSSTPANETRLMGAGFGLLGAVCAGFATIETRKLTQTENTGAIVAYFMTLTTLVGLLSIFAGWVAPQFMWKWPNFWDAILLITMGVTGGIGQITLTQSFRHADASLIAPFDYISMVWAILVGWLLFGELPKAIVVLGSSVVVAAGIFVIWREHRLGLDRSQQKASSPTRAL